MLQVTPSANRRKAFEPSAIIAKAQENICARYDVGESMHAVILSVEKYKWRETGRAKKINTSIGS